MDYIQTSFTHIAIIIKVFQDIDNLAEKIHLLIKSKQWNINRNICVHWYVHLHIFWTTGQAVLLNT